MNIALHEMLELKWEATVEKLLPKCNVIFFWFLINNLPRKFYDKTLQKNLKALTKTQPHTHTHRYKIKVKYYY